MRKNTFLALVAFLLIACDATSESVSQTKTTAVQLSFATGPPQLSTPSKNYTYQQGKNISLLLPNSGGAALRCSSKPALPGSLRLTITGGNCIISGIAPSQPSHKNSYEISAHNNSGVSSVAIRLMFVQLPPELSVTKSDYIFPLDVPIEPIIFRNEGERRAYASRTNLAIPFPLDCTLMQRGTPV